MMENELDIKSEYGGVTIVWRKIETCLHPPALRTGFSSYNKENVTMMRQSILGFNQAKRSKANARWGTKAPVLTQF